MFQTAASIPSPLLSTGPSRTSSSSRKLRGGRSPWGLADQVLISGTNFVTMVIVGRNLGKAGFGEFSLIYNLLLFANMIQASLITQPHNVLGSAAKRRETMPTTLSARPPFRP